MAECSHTPIFGGPRTEESLTLTERVWYRRAIQALQEANIPFLLGGGWALYAYTGKCRGPSKDIDLMIEPDHDHAATEALALAGFQDYYACKPYQRHWIYRATREGVIVDLIWQLVNRRGEVNRSWFDHTPTVNFLGHEVQLQRPEHTMFPMFYVMHPERCEFQNIINIIRGLKGELNWELLLRLLREKPPLGHQRDDTPLLTAALTVYMWAFSSDAPLLPWQVRDHLGLPFVPKSADCRAEILDSRDWAAPVGGALVIPPLIPPV